MEGSNNNPTKFQILKRIVLKYSQSDEWEEAKDEWRACEYEKAGDHDYHICKCTHAGIVELYEIVNIHTGAVLRPIGSKCIQNFKSQAFAADAETLRSRDRKMQAGEHRGTRYADIPDQYLTEIRDNRRDYPQRAYKRLIGWCDRMDNLKALQEVASTGSVPPNRDLPTTVEDVVYRAFGKRLFTVQALTDDEVEVRYAKLAWRDEAQVCLEGFITFQAAPTHKLIVQDISSILMSWKDFALEGSRPLDIVIGDDLYGWTALEVARTERRTTAL